MCSALCTIVADTIALNRPDNFPSYPPDDVYLGKGQALLLRTLECVSEEKDLGVIISEDLKCEKQCSEAVKKANRMLGMIKRNFIDRS